MPTSSINRDDDRGVIWARRRVELGRKLRAARLARGLTQEALALASSVSRNMVIEIESGRRGVLAERIPDLTEALGIEPGALL